MAYVAPYIDETGLHIPRYQDIVDDMVDGAKAIFGDDIYLENDSADYQLISVFALKTYDMLQALMYAYNARSPATAIGSSLDVVCKMNGLKRKEAGYSTCDVKITGLPNTQILNGVIQDAANTLWDLPKMVIIPESGTVVTTATCEIAGAVTVAIGDLSKIYTPTYGWTSVTNEGTAVIGNEIETDGALRLRQTKSVAMPSQTMLDGTLAAIMAIDEVNRVAVYENDTNSADVSTANPYGLPAHSITCVVEGGDRGEIANAILYHKGIGCYTNGDQTEEIIGDNGYVNYVRFCRPTYVDVYVEVKLKKYKGYISASASDVANAINDYLASLTMGSNISVSMLIGIAVGCNADVNAPTFGVQSLKIGTSAESLGTNDIVITYNQIPQTNLDEIDVEAVN